MSNINNIHVLSRAVIIDQNHILLCKTTDLPINFYFLPGGHIEHEESAEAALLRELNEEAGAKAYTKRFLGCLEYSFTPGHNSKCHNHEYNFVFEAEAETLTIDNKLPQLEKHIELTWMPLSQIAEIDLRAEPFKTLVPLWLKSPSPTVLHSVMV